MPDFRRLYELIKQGEGQYLDFKQHITSAHKIARTIVSFTNSDGGLILVGIDDEGTITGVDPAQEKHMLIRAVKKHCDPIIYLHFRELRARRKTVLEVRVEKSRIEHRALDEAGRWIPYVRVEDQSVLAPGFESENGSGGMRGPIPILMEKNQGLVNYLEDNDSISIKDYMQMMNLSYHVAQRSLNELTEYGVLDRDEIGGRAWYYLRPADA